MSIQIYNSGAYVRVVNSTTNVVVNYIKSTLVIQKDNNDSFFMKNDSFINYYKYCQVSTPSSSGIDDLIATITSWNTAGDTVTTTFDNTVLDMMSQLKVSSPKVVQLSLQNLFDANPLQINEVNVSSAGSTPNANQNSVSMFVAPITGSRIIRQSKLYPTHIHGSTTFAYVNGILTTNTTNSNVVSKIGLFDDSNDITNGVGGNGVFFQYDNTSNLALVYRTNYGGSQADYVVPQGSWNIDPLNGSGISGQSLNVSGVTDFIFEWHQVSNSNVVRAGIYGNGLKYAHAFSNMPLFGNPCLPVRFEIGNDSNLGSANSATMVQGPATVYTDTAYHGPYNMFSKSRYEFISLTTPWCPHPLMSIRLQTPYTRAKLFPTEIEILNIASGGVGKWSLILNGCLNSPDWQTICHSYAEIDMCSTHVGGGRVLASGYFYDTGVTKISLTDKEIELLCSIDGTTDVLSVEINLVNGALNVSGSITWKERD